MFSMEIRKNVLLALAGSGEGNHCEIYAQSALHNKDLLSKEKDFARALSQLGKDILPPLVSLLFLSHIRKKVYQQESGLQ